MRTFQVCYAPDGESGSAPASGETPVSGETSVPGDSSGGDSFSGLGGFDEIEVNLDAGDPSASQVSEGAAATPPLFPASPPLAPATPEATSAPAPTAPAPVPPVPAQAAPAPVAPTAPPAQAEAAPAAPASASGPMDAGVLLQQLSEHRDGVISALASDRRFQLSQEEATALETDPARAVPQLLARTFYEATNATLTHINNLVPAMIAKYTRGMELQRKAETEFYGKFSALKPELHDADVRLFGNLIKQTNPNLSRNDFFAMIAAAVSAKHGIVPVANVAPNGGMNGAAIPKPAPQQPFTPATPGASVRTVPVDEHPFAGLGRDFDN